MEGLVHTVLTGGGAGGWMMRQALLYPLIHAALHTITAQPPTDSGLVQLGSVPGNT